MEPSKREPPASPLPSGSLRAEAEAGGAGCAGGRTPGWRGHGTQAVESNERRQSKGERGRVLLLEGKSRMKVPNGARLRPR